MDSVPSRLEVVLDPWIEGLWKAIKRALSKMSSDRSGQFKGDVAKDAPDSSVPDVQLNLLSLTDQQNCKSAGASVESDSKFASDASSSVSATQTAVSDLKPASPVGSPGLASQPGGIASVSTSAPETQTGGVGVHHVTLAASLTCSMPPLSESSLNVPTLPPPYLDVSLQEVDSMGEVREEVSAKINISPIFHFFLFFFKDPTVQIE